MSNSAKKKRDKKRKAEREEEQERKERTRGALHVHHEFLLNSCPTFTKPKPNESAEIREEIETKIKRGRRGVLLVQCDP